MAARPPIPGLDQTGSGGGGSGLPAGGLTGEVLKKASAADGDVEWGPPGLIIPYVGGSTISTLNDATIYYAGKPLRSMGTTESEFYHYFRHAGTVNKIEVAWCAQSNAGTSEDVSLYFRLNGTTDTLIGTIADTNRYKRFTVSGLGLAIAVDNFFTIKMAAVTWVTNPTNVSIGYDVYLET